MTEDILAVWLLTHLQILAGITACHGVKGLSSSYLLLFHLDSPKTRWPTFDKWKAENLQYNVKEIEEKVLVQRITSQSELSPNVSQDLSLHLKPVHPNFSPMRFQGWAEVSAYSQYFLEIQWPSREWIERNNLTLSNCFHELYIHAEKRENLKLSQWLWWDKSLCGGGKFSIS